MEASTGRLANRCSVHPATMSGRRTLVRARERSHGRGRRRVALHGASHRLCVKRRAEVTLRSEAFSLAPARVASSVRVGEVAGPRCRFAGVSRPRWVDVTPRGALPDSPR